MYLRILFFLHEIPKWNIFPFTGPTSVLNAMASVVGPDPTAPAYQYHDDPYLIPFNSADKEDFLLAKDSGRQAAR